MLTGMTERDWSIVGPSRHWGIMPLGQRPGLPWRSGRIDAQTRHRASRCRLRSGLGAADRRHIGKRQLAAAVLGVGSDLNAATMSNVRGAGHRSC